MLYSNRYYLQLAGLEGVSRVVVKNQTNAVAADYDWRTGCAFWSDVTTRGSTLRKFCGLNNVGDNDEDDKVVQLATLRNPDGLAVDWVARNLYWCDKGSDTVEVASLEGKHRRVLISGGGLKEPRALVVNPLEGWLYWSDWGKNPHVGRAWMDGTHREVIISEGLGEMVN